MPLDPATLVYLLHHPIGPDDRRPVDRLVTLALVRDLVAHLDVPAISQAVDGAIREHVAIPRVVA